ncbi:hypothetical protein L6R52_16885 [Myxococcota bacterium]|nr:hypothetical protein [Myxococcota bacterium]
MNNPSGLEASTDRIRGEWIHRLESAHVLMGPREAIAHELGRWLEHLGPAASGDESAARELHKLVAFHARALGAEGRPASAALTQVLLLEDAIDAVAASPALRPVFRELLRIVADAHALGASERAKNRHQLEIRDFSPVVRLGETALLGFLLGSMESDLIDAMLGRLLRETVRTGATHVVLDAFGAARDNDTFHHTIAAFQRHEIGGRVHLTITGLRDPDATRDALAALGCNMDRLAFTADANSAIADVMDRRGARSG